MTYDRNKNTQKLRLSFLSPFGTRIGRLEINNKTALWVDKEGMRSVQEHPIFRAWHSKRWVAELDFLVGYLTKNNIGRSLVDESEHPALYRGAKTSIRCHGIEPRVCEIEKTGLDARIEFSLLKCS